MASQSSAPVPYWPAGFRVRPPVQVGQPEVEVTDIVSGRRFRWAPEALAKAILSTDGPAASTGDAQRWTAAVEAAHESQSQLVDGMRHWYARGWHPSEQYYLASRRWGYLDEQDNDGTVRAAVVERFLADDGEPPAEELGTGPRTALGKPAPPGEQKLSRLLLGRRTGRAYVREPVPLEVLSGLLWHGLHEVRARRVAMDRSEPLSYLNSFGSAWDFFVCAYGVADLDPGIYRYDVSGHELIAVRPGQHRQAMVKVLQGMRSPATAAWTLGMVADAPRYQWRYRSESGLRRLYVEAGILGQELVLLGGSYGLSTLTTPAQQDRLFLEFFKLSRDRYVPIYTLTTGLVPRSGGGDFYEHPDDFYENPDVPEDTIG
jgi:SagB-type dehydrogenase family enzyme